MHGRSRVHANWPESLCSLLQILMPYTTTNLRLTCASNCTDVRVKSSSDKRCEIGFDLRSGSWRVRRFLATTCMHVCNRVGGEFDECMLVGHAGVRRLRRSLLRLQFKLEGQSTREEAVLVRVPSICWPCVFRWGVDVLRSYMHNTFNLWAAADSLKGSEENTSVLKSTNEIRPTH